MASPENEQPARLPELSADAAVLWDVLQDHYMLPVDRDNFLQAAELVTSRRAFVDENEDGHLYIYRRV